MAQYEVIVGGTRTMYRGSDASRAGALASEYRQRRQHTVLRRDGEVLMEVYGNMGKRKRGHRRHGNAMTERRARVVRESETRFEQARERHDPKRFKRGGGYTPEEYKAIARRAGISRAPSNRAKGKLEAFTFKHNPPDRLFAYYNKSMTEVTTWTGDKLGDIVWLGKVARGFGGGKTQAIRMRGINGVMYAGRCNLTGGTYCRLIRMVGTRTR